MLTRIDLIDVVVSTTAWLKCGYTFVCALLALAWYFAGTARRAGLKKSQQRKKSEVSSASPKHLPSLTILIPTAGGRSRALQHWKALLALQYPGCLRVHILVHSEDDPSFGLAQQLLHTADGSVSVNVSLTGHASECSQKIHNLCYGIEKAPCDSKYILCMDDDSNIHNAMLQDMIYALETDPSIFMATGYPFDAPTYRVASCFAYAVLAFHFKLIIAFSAPRVSVVWGGCMLFRLKDLLEDRHGLIKAWKAGGYSDDMTAAAICTSKQLRIHSPPSAVFLQYVDGSTNLSDCWSYICRQMITLNTYANFHNRVLNDALMFASAVDGLMTTVAATTIAAKSIIAAVCVAGHLVPFSSLRRAPVDGAGGVCDCTASQLDFSTCAMVVMFGLMYTSSARFGQIILKVIAEHAPEQDAPHQLSYPRIWFGMLVHSILTPAAVLFNLIRREITWSGIRYRIGGGRVWGVVHPRATSSCSKKGPAQ